MSSRKRQESMKERRKYRNKEEELRNSYIINAKNEIQTKQILNDYFISFSPQIKIIEGWLVYFFRRNLKICRYKMDPNTNCLGDRHFKFGEEKNNHI